MHLEIPYSWGYQVVEGVVNERQPPQLVIGEQREYLQKDVGRKLPGKAKKFLNWGNEVEGVDFKMRHRSAVAHMCRLTRLPDGLDIGDKDEHGAGASAGRGCVLRNPGRCRCFKPLPIARS